LPIKRNFGEVSSKLEEVERKFQKIKVDDDDKISIKKEIRLSIKPKNTIVLMSNSNRKIKPKMTEYYKD
jgi:hypothetical protein